MSLAAAAVVDVVQKAAHRQAAAAAARTVRAAIRSQASRVGGLAFAALRGALALVADFAVSAGFPAATTIGLVAQSVETTTVAAQTVAFRPEGAGCATCVATVDVGHAVAVVAELALPTGVVAAGAVRAVLVDVDADLAAAGAVMRAGP